ncbi:hypothetical protein DA69_13865 [Brevundimonas naejangsanensis]|uniref:Uncharacterized protein n=1 Tax=Brevundimonas naejangsanensis TaxID=588932 RepID=A0A172Y906_9CAUL|nr:hypothetical protein DA69_13865 [Brevundimonas naejangsanensis]
MRRCVAIGVLAFSIGLAACDGPAASQGEEAAARSFEPDAASAAASTGGASPASAGAIRGAPAFAVVYPGAQADGAPIAANGPSGPGGLITFSTDADPEAVVAFYRQRAEQAGLASIMAMNQGEARAYGAAASGDNGASLQVVASPGEDGLTSVQLSWSAGA